MHAYQAHYQGKTILITGGAGAIGANLARTIAQLNAKRVIVLDDLSAAYTWNIPSLPNVLFVKGSVTGHHLVPIADRSVQNRHPHHYTIFRGGEHFLDSRPHNCLGGFAQAQSQMYKSMDVPEIFRIWHRFLEKFNAGSPLLTPNQMTHLELL